MRDSDQDSARPAQNKSGLSGTKASTCVRCRMNLS